MAKQTVETNEELLNEVGGKPVVTHDEYLQTKIDEAINAKLRLMRENTFTLAATVTDIKVREGAEKKDKDGIPTGERWPDSFYVDFSFQGGTFTERLNEAMGKVS